MTQQPLQKKALSKSTATPSSSEFLQTRPFAQINNTVTQEQQAPPDLQAQVDRASRFGHSFGKLAIQPKLTIGQPGDKYEQEADAVAAQVVQRINAPTSLSTAQGQAVQRETAEEELQMKPLVGTIQRQEVAQEDELQMKPMVQRREAIGGGAASPDLEQSIQSAKGGGQPLDQSIRQPMEQAFEADFSGVKIHTDSQSDHLNRSIQARAFTTKNDIFFSKGAYNPSSPSGQELIAHELTHVVQQNNNLLSRSLSPQIKLADSAPDSNVPLLQCDETDKFTQMFGSKASSEMVPRPGNQEDENELELDLDDIELELDDQEESQTNTEQGNYAATLANYENIATPKRKGFWNKLTDRWKGSDKKEITTAFAGRAVDAFNIKSATDKIHNALGAAKGVKIEDAKSDSLLYKILGETFAEIIGKIGTGISAIVTAGKSIWDWAGRYQHMKGLRAKLETSDLGLREAITYGYAKVRRSVWEGFADMVFNVTQSVCRVITVLSGGTAVVAPILDAALTLAKVVKRLVHAAKGVYKWIVGTRGVNRELNAGNIVQYAASGNEDAIELIYVFKPFKFLDEYHGTKPKEKTINSKIDAVADTKVRTIENAGRRLLNKNVSEFLDLRQLDLPTMKANLPAILEQVPEYTPKMVENLKDLLTSMSTI